VRSWISEAEIEVKENTEVVVCVRKAATTDTKMVSLFSALSLFIDSRGPSPASTSLLFLPHLPHFAPALRSHSTPQAPPTLPLLSKSIPPLPRCPPSRQVRPAVVLRLRRRRIWRKLGGRGMPTGRDIVVHEVVVKRVLRKVGKAAEEGGEEEDGAKWEEGAGLRVREG
jgi:hypothetical protein